ncbi:MULTISPECIES: hypothetical protein [unclassified Halobacteriovorax]|uniref:hypothetical protein n=1 Tax=unclassified Halobacteriovorax TaxID=2639665 RepID=UPI00399B1CF2
MAKQSKKVPLFNLSTVINGQSYEVALPVSRVSQLAGVSSKTARRWIDGTQQPHPDTLELLKIRVFGLVPDPAFSDYFIHEGVLHTPTGQRLEPRELEIFVWLRGLYYRGIEDNKRRKEELDELLRLLPAADLLRQRR